MYDSGENWYGLSSILPTRYISSESNGETKSMDQLKYLPITIDRNYTTLSILGKAFPKKYFYFFMTSSIILILKKLTN